MIIGYSKKLLADHDYMLHETVPLHFRSFVSERGGVPEAGSGQHGGGPGILLGK
jgi:hypothetical protein